MIPALNTKNRTKKITQNLIPVLLFAIFILGVFAVCPSESHAAYFSDNSFNNAKSICPKKSTYFASVRANTIMVTPDWINRSSDATYHWASKYKGKLENVSNLKNSFDTGSLGFSNKEVGDTHWQPSPKYDSYNDDRSKHKGYWFRLKDSSREGQTVNCTGKKTIIFRFPKAVKTPAGTAYDLLLQVHQLYTKGGNTYFFFYTTHGGIALEGREKKNGVEVKSDRLCWALCELKLVRHGTNTKVPFNNLMSAFWDIDKFEGINLPNTDINKSNIYRPFQNQSDLGYRGDIIIGNKGHSNKSQLIDFYVKGSELNKGGLKFAYGMGQNSRSKTMDIQLRVPKYKITYKNSTGGYVKKLVKTGDYSWRIGSSDTSKTSEIRFEYENTKGTNPSPKYGYHFTYWTANTAVKVGNTTYKKGAHLTTARVKNVTVHGNITFTAHFETKQYTIKIKKRNTGSTNLKGAKFTLKGSGVTGSIKKTGTTDSNGNIVFKNVPISTHGKSYTLVETSAPNGYIGTGRKWTVHVAENGKLTGTLTKCSKTGRYYIIKNTPKKKASVKIKKVDSATNAPLSGAEFHLAGTSNMGESVLMKVTTGANGIAQFNNVPEGNYRLRERHAPSGYDLPTAPKKFTNKETGSSYRYWPVAITVSNDNKVVVKVNRTKMNSSNTYTYTIKNKKKPEPSQNPTYAKLKLLKKDEDSNTWLSGAKFSITPITENKAFKTGTTNSDGYLELTGLNPESDYILTEIQPPEGYLITGGPYFVETDNSGNARVYTMTEDGGKDTELTTATNSSSNTGYVVTNKEKPANMKTAGFRIVKKDDQTGNPIEGVVFRLVHDPSKTEESAASKAIDITDETGSDGRLSFVNLPKGTYLLQEIEAPAGYSIPAKPWTVKIETGE